jgi:tRNA threonylcarbamoyladenosine biosynthesis protein TsaE
VRAGVLRLRSVASRPHSAQNDKVNVARSPITLTPHEYITHSAEETIDLGRKLAATLKELRLVILRGDLGAGKTTLVKGLAEGLNAASQDDVTSPTFTLIHEYRGAEVTLYHVDLYRIDTQRELETLGVDELLAEEANLVLVEWGEKFPRLLAEGDAEISIERRGEQERTFVVITK